VEKYGTAGQAADDNMAHAHCWIPNATNTRLERVTLIAFPVQQWLHERTKYYVIRTLSAFLLFVVSD
jgi:hypothetical protein